MQRAAWCWLLVALGVCSSQAGVPAGGSEDMEPRRPPPRVVVPGTVRAIYTGSARAPIAGLWLDRRPLAFFHDPEGSVTALEAHERLERGESITLSRDWKRYVRTTRDEQGTLFRSGQRQIHLCGRAAIAIDSRGRTSVAWTVPLDEAEAQLSLLGEDGEILAQRPIGRLGQPEWADVADSGERVALGNAQATLVLDRRGDSEAWFRGAAQGRLSPDGAWLALERVDRGQIVSLVRLGAQAVDLEVQDKAVALAFDATGTRLARVAPSSLQTFRITGEKPVLESERAPPEGFRWRSAAYSAGGLLAAGRIRIATRPQRRPADPPEPDTPGSAVIGVDLYSDDGAPPTSVTWEVQDWNLRAPELAFGADGALFALAWPSAYEVIP